MAPTNDITATPAADQHISHGGKDYTTIKEGLAYILIPASASKIPQTTPKGANAPQSVFYNPIQQFNRDLSVLAIKAYGEEAIERKERSIAKNKQKIQDKKRKREDDGLRDSSRKAGKIEKEKGAIGSANPGPAAEIVSESVVEESTDTQQDKENGSVEAANAVVDNSVSIGTNGDVEMVTADEQLLVEQKAASAKTTEAPSIEAIPAKDNLSSQPKKPSFTILDALSATGLRALRYAHEIPFTTSVTANDLLPDATKSIKLNVQHNKLEDKIQTVTGNALSHMYNVACGEYKENGKPKAKYDVIDLDPYGTAAPFLDAAVQSVKEDGGLLCVTCTDAGVWASNGYPEKAFSLYGGVTIKGPQSHEGGLRLILHAIATSAAKYGLAMEPLLSLSIDFYARVFVRIHKSANEVKFLAGKTMVVYNCDEGCGAWTTQTIGKNKLAANKSGKGHFWKHVYSQAPSASEHCVHCGMKTHMAGPMYGGPMQSPEFIKKILDGLPNASKDTYQTHARIEGMLSTALEEHLPPIVEDTNSPTHPSKTNRYDPAALDLYPFFFIPSTLAKVLHCVTPHENAVRGGLRHLGYRATRSHTKGGCIKTDAPWEVIWDVMREWVKQKAPIKEGALKEGSAGWRILRLGEGEVKEGEKPNLKVVFDEKLGMERDAKKLVRYQINPRENWGPMNRASGKDKA
ncbi:S-adenosyl-L-methionine-dependent methyltransferase [Glarea lozoyensis ATCC 20868]|uniref:tRNA (guanine(26)-N(2))-dimethyltransferase n=1 Tax=Glarea lozoyensis (strain ATCC 20868 / MF5171) TaxID=1116229 RepID=S3CH49_GLAL2|nr:S-adenosyl-L-methionine-dependent methyltransferase [Glarea lozoyensis ATCC 20868]EPE25195.1 S-adenosyl-L-methionine-dependent methyltransferase [Glarea lozoyensis ATCC 20868]